MDQIVSTLLTAPLTTLVLVAMGTMILKDVVSGLASGLLFVLNRNFNVSDKIVLDGKDGTIINIGWRQTIIEIDDVWIYINNSQINRLQLGKRKQ